MVWPCQATRNANAGAPEACTTAMGTTTSPAGPRSNRSGCRSVSSWKWTGNRRRTPVEPGNSTSIAACTRSPTPAGPATCNVARPPAGIVYGVFDAAS